MLATALRSSARLVIAPTAATNRTMSSLVFLRSGPALARAAAGPAARPSPPQALRSLQVRAEKQPQRGQEQQQQQSVAKKEETQVEAPRSSAGAELMYPTDAFNDVLPVPFRRMAGTMAQMQREMDSLLGAFGMPSLLADPFDVFDRTAVAPLLARRAAAPLGGALSRLVSLEISDDDKGYTITAEVPGFQKNDIKVTLSEDGVLTMAGEIKEEEQAEEAAKEGAAAPKPRVRRYSTFRRSVQLPDEINAEGITASTEHGVLTVHVPKAPKPAPKMKEIPIA